MTEDPSFTDYLQARLSHLTNVQGIIARLGGYSATLKGLSITLSGAAVALTNSSEPRLFVGLGSAVCLSFALLDGYYLTLERDFRSLYKEVSDRPIADAFSLGITPQPFSVFRYIKSLFSPSVLGFYFLILLLLLLATVTFHSEAKENPAPPVQITITI